MRRLLKNTIITGIIIGLFPVVSSNISANTSTSVSSPVIESDGTVVWDCVYFGTYPQSDETGEISEPIKWRVLSVDKGNAILMSDCNLDVQPYNTAYEAVTWEESTLRAWLNDYFYNTAFSNQEKSAIKDSVVINNDNAQFGVIGGNSTIDKVYILSAEESMYEKYGFLNNESENAARVRKNTAYVAAGGSLDEENRGGYEVNEADLWWLRTPGKTQNRAMMVDYNGEISYSGDLVSLLNNMVCPVISLDITNDSVWSYAGTVNSNNEISEIVTTTEDITVEMSSTSENKTVVEETSITEKVTTGEKVTTSKKTTNVQQPTSNKISLGNAKIKTAKKKKTNRKLKITIKKVKGANRYQVKISKSKSFKKIIYKKYVKKLKTTLISSKLKNKKKLYIKVRAVLKKGNKYHYGKWSKGKRVSIS